MTERALAMCLLLTACSGPGAHCPPAELTPVTDEPAFALVTSDYASSAVALLDAQGELLSEAFIDSGSARPGLATALSGDISLPTSLPSAGHLWWVDRIGVDLLGEAEFATGDVRQLATTPTRIAGEAAFRANPHDVLALPDGRWLVSRYEPNYAPDAQPLDRGNDLLVMDGATGTLQARIGIEALDEDVADADATTRTYARPDRLLLRQGRVVVGLARLSPDFRTAAPGAVALVDADTGEVEATLLPGLSDCGEVEASRDDDARFFVACVGPTHTDLAGRRDGAGVASLRVPASGPAMLEWIWRAADHPELPPPTHALAPLMDDVLIVASMGDDGEEPDRLLRLRLADDAGEVVYESAQAFTLGRGAVSPGADFLLMPDADVGVLRFEITSSALGSPTTLAASPCRRLPARELRVLR